MKNTTDIKGQYFMDDSREGQRLERKVNANEFVDRFLSPHLDQLNNARILEAGCGPGAFLRVIANNYTDHQVTGIDISSERIQTANEKARELDNATAICANIYNLPFPDNHFEFIYSRFLFEYLQYPVAAAEELHRVCKPGGKLLLQDLDSQFTFYPALSPRLNEVLQSLNQRTGFDPDIGRKLYSIGRSAGFSFVNIESEMYHSVFGQIDDFNYELWQLKLDIAFENWEALFGASAEGVKSEMLNSLKSEDSIMFSTLFTTTFIKS